MLNRGARFWSCGLVLLLSGLTGCDWLRPSPPPAPGPATQAEQIDPAATATPEYTPPPAPDPSEAEEEEPKSFPLTEAHEDAPMVEGCEGKGPDERPEGSNCWGFFPEQCGADQAASFLGRTATPELRDRIRALAPREKARFVLPGERLPRRRDAGRLTVDMTLSGKITAIECH